jgi:acid phosphatase (class A)
MVPEKATELYARGYQYGANRVIAGVHFPTDLEAGRMAATVIAAGLMQNPQFQSEFETAKAELRAAQQL